MDTPVQPHHRHFRLILGISASVGILAGVGVWIYYTTQPKQVSTAPLRRVIQTVATPQVFTDVVVTAVSVDGSDIHATYIMTTANGIATPHTYLIHTNKQTVLQTQTPAGTGVTFSPLKLADIKTGDHLHAYNNANIYPLSEFTALKIYLIH